MSLNMAGLGNLLGCLGAQIYCWVSVDPSPPTHVLRVGVGGMTKCGFYPVLIIPRLESLTACLLKQLMCYEVGESSVSWCVI